jgi:DNA gyrase subunit A
LPTYPSTGSGLHYPHGAILLLSETMNFTPADLVSQIKDDYLAYSMSVIVGRAIPALTDGLKPAQRRVLTAMRGLNLKPDGKYMKSARVDGETSGKYHPHGGAYGVMVTLAAPWNNNLPLIDGQGNWGSSVDGAAASRYTECKLTPFANDCLLADSETWQTADNYDGSLQEPIELNVRVPLVLLNGQEGIGVGFATKIPPHSLRDICDAVTKGSLLTPSFPSGCDIINDEGLDSYQKTGTGTLRLRAKCEITAEGTGKRTKTIATFTNLPAGTNPEKIGQQIKDALDKGNVTGITAVSDQSDLTGDRLAVTLKTGTDSQLAIRQLYHYTDLDTKYSARLLVVDGTKPVELNPSELIARWSLWRLGRLGACFQFELDKSESRLEIIRGYLKAIGKIDTVIKIIKASASPKEALIELVSNRTLKFTADQARAILEMKLRALTNLDSEELAQEEGSLTARIDELKELIGNEKARKTYMLKEIKEIGVRYGEERRSELIGIPEGIAVEKKTSGQAPAKPRFIKIDMKKGVAEQAKGPRGCLVVERSEKVITLTQDGTLKKLPANYKGPLGEGYSPVMLAKKETEVKERSYLMVFTLGDQLKAMAIAGEDLTKATSKGKQALPAGATMLYFGEGSYVVPWASTRKKKVELFPVTTKAGKPGGKGIKVASLDEVKT